MFSDVYERIRINWFGSWAWNANTYGPRVLITEHKDGYVQIAEYKRNTKITHGRRVRIYFDGHIEDAFLKENINHGPELFILNNGPYYINMYKEGVW